MVSKVDDLLGSTTSDLLEVSKRVSKKGVKKKKLPDYEDGDVRRVPIDAIMPNPDQPRKSFTENEMGEIKASIKENGVLQPVIVRPVDDGKFILVAGERRFRSVQTLLENSEIDWDHIPAVIKTEGDILEIALIENIQRQDLKPIEEAEAYQLLINQHGYTRDQLAKTLGKARTTLTEKMSINRLPDVIKDQCRTSDILSSSILVEIAKQPSEKEMTKLFESVKGGAFTVKEIRKITRKKKQSNKVSKTNPILKKIDAMVKALDNIDLKDDKVKAKLQTLYDMLGTKLVVCNKGRGGTGKK